MPSVFRNILLLGNRGMLGGAFEKFLPDEFPSARLTCADVGELDIRDPERVRKFMNELDPDLVINASAYTNVDGAEQDAGAAFGVNTEGVGYLAQSAGRATIVHFSTDFVFDGLAAEPYPEDAFANPLGLYGESKLQGEVALRQSGARHLIIRTSWLYGPGGRNFPVAILSRARGSDEPLRVVADQRGRPTYTHDLVDGTLRLLECAAVGTFHFQNGGEIVSWADFAGFLLAEAGLSVTVVGITSEDWAALRPGSARRPRMSALALDKFTDVAGYAPRDWRVAAREYVRSGSL